MRAQALPAAVAAVVVPPPLSACSTLPLTPAVQPRLPDPPSRLLQQLQPLPKPPRSQTGLLGS